MHYLRFKIVDLDDINILIDVIALGVAHKILRLGIRNIESQKEYEQLISLLSTNVKVFKVIAKDLVELANSIPGSNVSVTGERLLQELDKGASILHPRFKKVVVSFANYFLSNKIGRIAYSYRNLRNIVVKLIQGKISKKSSENVKYINFDFFDKNKL